MHLAEFDFDLPRELIADRPAEPRDSARLLVLPAEGAVADRHIADLPRLLRPGDLLVFNDTKVIPARLVGRRGLATVQITLAREPPRGARRGLGGRGPFFRVRGGDAREKGVSAEGGGGRAGASVRTKGARARGARMGGGGPTSLRLLKSAAVEKGEPRGFGGETRLFILP